MRLHGLGGRCAEPSQTEGQCGARLLVGTRAMPAPTVPSRRTKNGHQVMPTTQRSKGSLHAEAHEPSVCLFRPKNIRASRVMLQEARAGMVWRERRKDLKNPLSGGSHLGLGGKLLSRRDSVKAESLRCSHHHFCRDFQQGKH